MSPESKRTEELLHHAKALRAMARALIGNRTEAEDLVQDTLVLALESPPAWGDGIGGWLRGVLRQKARHRHRADASRARREIGSAKREALPPTVDIVARRAQLATLVEEVLHLREPYQTVLYLRFFEEKGPGEIARELSVPEGTIASQVSRGLELLRIRLDARTGGDRDAWVGALLPWFASESAKTAIPVGGASMAGAMKLVGSAVVLGSLLLYVNNSNEIDQESSGLSPVAGSLQNEWTPPSRPDLPVQERFALQPEAEAPSVSTETFDQPADETKNAPMLATLPSEPVMETPETGWVVELLPANSPPRTLTSAGIKRSFQFELSSEVDPAKDKPFYTEDTRVWMNIEFSYVAELEFLDRYESRIVGPFSSFERTFAGEWDVIEPDFQNNPTSPEPKLHQGKSLFEHRTQVFKKHETEDRLVASFKAPKTGDSSTWFMGIDPNLDMPMLRPPENAIAGTEWTVPIRKLRPLLKPGGDLRVQFRERDLPPTEGFPLLNFMDSPEESWSQSTCKLTSLGVQKLEGRESLPFTAALIISGTVRPATHGANESLAEAEPLEWTLQIDLNGTGSWDLTNQRLASLDMDGDVVVTFKPDNAKPNASATVPEIGVRFGAAISMQVEDEAIR